MSFCHQKSTCFALFFLDSVSERWRNDWSSTKSSPVNGFVYYAIWGDSKSFYMNYTAVISPKNVVLFIMFVHDGLSEFAAWFVPQLITIELIN